MLQSTEWDPATPFHQLSKKARNRLVEILKRWKLGRVREVPLKRGEVTAGGVPLDDVGPGAKKSRKVRGLYPCGEVLHIAGPMGGQNLQAAFSTGFLAGETAVRPGPYPTSGSA